jgi:signal transduction histidine kinase
MNREAILRRFELALVAVFATTLAAAALVSAMRSRRAEAAKRREYLDRLATWQQAARRHAHELRTPLTAARLEVERLGDVALRAGATVSVEPILEELDRLARYTREYASFGAVGEPVLRREPLAHVVDEFISTFGNAWPGLALRLEQSGDAHVCADRDMLRQVLVNLCTNSARAGAGSVAFLISRERARATLDVRDDGGGIPDSLLARIFDPYVTTTRPGEGMGLGLAISRKIMLDHGGDLALAATSPLGTTFRLTFGDAACN